jgi:equilibrative nucleoside transporter 1/2/3
MYFFSGVFLGTASLLALSLLIQRNDNSAPQDTEHKHHDFGSMWRILKWPASSNFLCLCIGSVSPVFASKIVSVVPEDTAPILQRHEAFIPLAIVLWNIGDLLGSVLAIFSGGLVRYPLAIFFLNLARLTLVPLYLLCNINGKGSFAGDWFYLLVVQFTFGLTQGWLLATSMSGIPTRVEEEERESAGAFMGLAMVTGLIAGSFLALAAAQA